MNAIEGKVLLVGAGPGDPDLITLRAARALENADVVFYDGLVDPRVIALASRAITFSVEKRVGRPSTTQETIHRLLVRAARRGKQVVRLKCGDPFVFGRGGEEALALAEANVPFEVIPGVSSSIAAASSALVPVTHRGIASAFVVVTGAPEKVWLEVVRGLPKSGVTLVMLMGLRVREALACELIANGFAPQTPACMVLGAHSERQSTWRGTIEELPHVPIHETDSDLPGTIIVGDVVNVAAQLSTFRAEATPSTASPGGARHVSA